MVSLQILMFRYFSLKEYSNYRVGYASRDSYNFMIYNRRAVLVPPDKKDEPFFSILKIFTQLKGPSWISKNLFLFQRFFSMIFKGYFLGWHRFFYVYPPLFMQLLIVSMKTSLDQWRETNNVIFFLRSFQEFIKKNV